MALSLCFIWGLLNVGLFGLKFFIILECVLILWFDRPEGVEEKGSDLLWTSSSSEEIGELIVEVTAAALAVLLSGELKDFSWD